MYIDVHAPQNMIYYDIIRPHQHIQMWQKYNRFWPVTPANFTICILFHWVEHLSSRKPLGKMPLHRVAQQLSHHIHPSGSPPFVNDLHRWYLKSGWSQRPNWKLVYQKARWQDHAKPCQTTARHIYVTNDDEWQNLATFAGFCGTAPRSHPTIYQIGHC